VKQPGDIKTEGGSDADMDVDTEGTADSAEDIHRQACFSLFLKFTKEVIDRLMID